MHRFLSAFVLVAEFFAFQDSTCHCSINFSNASIVSAKRTDQGLSIQVHNLPIHYRIYLVLIQI